LFSDFQKVSLNDVCYHAQIWKRKDYFYKLQEYVSIVKKRFDIQLYEYDDFSLQDDGNDSDDFM
jgi:hypothetical protein